MVYIIVFIIAVVFNVFKWFFDSVEKSKKIKALENELSRLKSKNNKLTDDNKFLSREKQVLEIKLSPIFDIEKHQEDMIKNLNEVKQERAVLTTECHELSKTKDMIKNLNEVTQERDVLLTECNELNKTKDRLISEIYDNNLLGFELEHSSYYSNKIKELIEKERDIQKKQSILIWNESEFGFLRKAEAERIKKKISSMYFLAFSLKFNEILKKTRYNNYDNQKNKLEAIAKSICQQIDKYTCSISSEFLKIKQKQLELMYLYKESEEAEKEEQRLIREQQKEERRRIKELEDKEELYEKEEEDIRVKMEFAINEMQQKHKAEQVFLKEKYDAHIDFLNKKLEEIIKNKQRIKSLAEQTKSGYVYIISNIGSFGENVYKIGMTRREDPNERISELSGASVPFRFDVHAQIWTDDAPLLERKLHLFFKHKRINLINERKEFFNVSIEEIEAACLSFGVASFKITKLAEAKEFYLSLHKKNKEGLHT